MSALRRARVGDEVRLDLIKSIRSIRSSQFDWTESVRVYLIGFFAILPFMVWFGLNLGLNNLKFGQEAIFCHWINSVQSNRLESIESIQSKIASWPNFKLFSPNRTNNGWFLPFLQLNRLEPTRFNRIESTKFGWFLTFLFRFGLNLGLNYLKFGQEAIFAIESTLTDLVWVESTRFE